MDYNMYYNMYSYTGTARELKRVIVSLLKSGSAKNVQKLNYLQDFVLDEGGKVIKTEGKLVMICTNDESKLLKFLEKNPQLKKITLS